MLTLIAIKTHNNARKSLEGPLGENFLRKHDAYKVPRFRILGQISSLVIVSPFLSAVSSHPSARTTAMQTTCHGTLGIALSSQSSVSGF